MTDIGTMLSGANVAPNGGNQTGGTGTVTNVTATAPLASSGGLNPNIDFPTWPVDAAGFLKNDGAGVLSWSAVTGFVRLLADPTSTFDTGGFHVTLQGVSEAGFCAGTATSPANSALFTGTTETFAHINIRGVGTSSDDGSAIRFGNDVNDFGAASLKLYGPGGGGGGQAPNSFALGTAVGPFELYSLDDAVPSAIKVMQVYNTVTRHQMVFGNVAYQDANPRLGQFQFVFDDPGNQVFSIGSPASDTAVTQLSLHAPADGDLGDGAHFIAYAVSGQTEDLGINVGGFEKVRIYGDNFADSTKIAVEAINPCATDNATASIFFSATDSGANTSNVSAGIELPNSVGVAGDWVVRTGGSGASGSGTKRVKVQGFAGGMEITADTRPLDLQYSNTTGFSGDSLRIQTLAATDSPVWLTLIGHDFVGAARGSGIGAGDIAGDGTWTVFFTPSSPPFAGVAPSGTGVLFIGSPNVSYNSGAVSLNGDDTGLFQPLAALDIRTTQFDSLHASSSVGISALFQTSATDGSNANPTAVFAGNTAQTAPLTEWRDQSGAQAVLKLDANEQVFASPAATFDFSNGAGGLWKFGPHGSFNGYPTFTDAGAANDIVPLNLLVFTDNSNYAVATMSASGLVIDRSGTFATGSSLVFGTANSHAGSTTTLQSGTAALVLANDADGSGLTAPGNVDAASYSVGAVPGESKTIVLALATSLTFTGGILTADT